MHEIGSIVKVVGNTLSRNGTAYHCLPIGSEAAIIMFVSLDRYLLSGLNEAGEVREQTLFSHDFQLMNINTNKKAKVFLKENENGLN